LKAGKFPKLPRRADGWVLSLVPTQLHRLLGAGESALVWLHQFRTIFLGGAATWPALAEAAANARLPVALSYGMTETAAMIAAQTPADFASGQRNSGRAMPHARIEIISTAARAKANALVREGETGLVRISGESVFRGYFAAKDENAARQGTVFQTEDLAFWDKHGGLNIVGRRDAVIITCGKKVFPSEVETSLRASGIFADVAVIGVPDAEWGHCVVACYPVRAGVRVDKERIASALQSLAAYKWPKRYVPIADWPRNLQGKLSRAALIAQAQG